VIYVWVRKTVDWQHERAVRAQLDPGFAPKVELWNETFDLPFHLFRHRVWKIAQLNLSRVERAVQAEWEEIPTGSLVVPLDDDDWLAPDLATVLEGRRNGRRVCYRWKSTWIERPTTLGHEIYSLRRRLLSTTQEKWVCSSANYALVKGAETRELAASHMSASRWVESAAEGSVETIDQRLSLINRTLASRTTLGGRRRPLSRSQLLRKFRRYRRLYDNPPATPELAWCRPYVVMMADLMAALAVKKR